MWIKYWTTVILKSLYNVLQIINLPKLHCNVNTTLNGKGTLMITIPGNLHPRLPSLMLSRIIWLIETYPPFPHKSRESLAHFSLASVHKPMCTHRCSPLSFKIATWRHPAVIIDLTMLSSVMSHPELITRDRKKIAYPRYPPWDHSSSGTHQLVFYICGQG